MSIQLHVKLPVITGTHDVIDAHVKVVREHINKLPLVTPDIDEICYNPHTYMLTKPISVRVETEMPMWLVRLVDWSYLEGRSTVLNYPFVLKGHTYFIEAKESQNKQTSVLLIEFARVENIIARDRSTALIQTLLHKGVLTSIDDDLLDELIAVGVASHDAMDLSPEDRAKLFQ